MHASVCRRLLARTENKFGEREKEEIARRSAEKNSVSAIQKNERSGWRKKNSASAIQKNERSDVCQAMFIYMASKHSDKLFWILWEYLCIETELNLNTKCIKPDKSLQAVLVNILHLMWR